MICPPAANWLRFITPRDIRVDACANGLPCRPSRPACHESGSGTPGTVHLRVGSDTAVSGHRAARASPGPRAGLEFVRVAQKSSESHGPHSPPRAGSSAAAWPGHAGGRRTADDSDASRDRLALQLELEPACPARYSLTPSLAEGPARPEPARCAGAGASARLVTRNLWFAYLPPVVIQ